MPGAYDGGMARRSKQLDHDLKLRGRGGYRPGAGRPRVYRSRMPHRVRASIPARAPVLVTLRVKADVPRLRQRGFVEAFRETLSRGSVRPGFRVVHYSIQNDHAHFLVEAQHKRLLANGMKSLGARFARAVNRTFGRVGAVLKQRFHHVLKGTPREVRHALAYVLLNVRKHYRQRRGRDAPVRLDTCSSGYWFDGWKPPAPVVAGRGPRFREVAKPRCWLLSKGWRRHGLIRADEVPGYPSR